MPVAATESFRSAEHPGPANRFGASQASAIEPVERSSAGAEPASGNRQARPGSDQEARSPARAALQQDRAAPGRARRLFPQGGRSVASVPERRRHAATAAQPDVPAVAG